nr:AMP-binding protein [uncultured Methanobacterium sp.]
MPVCIQKKWPWYGATMILDRIFTFKDLKEYSDRAANFFAQQGIKKGDRVMLTLKSRYEFWFCILALHKLGAITIPATHMLKTRDIVYRIKNAGIKMVVCIAEDGVPGYFDEAHLQLEEAPFIKALVGDEDREGWFNFRKEIENASPEFQRPTGEEGTQNDDVALIYFSSGTTGLPQDDHARLHLPSGPYNNSQVLAKCGGGWTTLHCG